MTAYDQGRYRGYRAAAGSVRNIETQLIEARRRRAAWLTRYALPYRRKYLDGFIRSLEIERERRVKDARLRAPGGPPSASASAFVPASSPVTVAGPKWWSPLSKPGGTPPPRRVPPPRPPAPGPGNGGT